MSLYLTDSKQAIRTPQSRLVRAKRAIRRVCLNVLSVLPGRWPKTFLRCLYCHYVFEDQKASFDNLMAVLSERGQFIDTSTCMDMLDGRRPIDGRYFHLSFDDGFRNVYTVAAPILKRRGIPAIVFVPSDWIDADWNRVEEYCQNTILLAGPLELMRWDDLRQMCRDGFEVGSHTRTHRRLAGISDRLDLLSDEIRGSRQQIEDHLGVRCDYISWPFGRMSDADATSLAAIRESGYRACFGAFRGSVIPGGTSRYAIPRHHFEVQWPMSHILYFAKGRGERSPCGS